MSFWSVLFLCDLFASQALAWSPVTSQAPQPAPGLHIQLMMSESACCRNAWCKYHDQILRTRFGHMLLSLLCAVKPKLIWCPLCGFLQADCPNFIRVLQFLNTSHIYACGTFAFSPRCTYIVRAVTPTFKLMVLLDMGIV